MCFLEIVFRIAIVYVNGVHIKQTAQYSTATLSKLGFFYTTADYSICGAASRHTAEKGLAPEDEENLARVFGGIAAKEAWPWMVELSDTESGKMVRWVLVKTNI